MLTIAHISTQGKIEHLFRRVALFSAAALIMLPALVSQTTACTKVSVVPLSTDPKVGDTIVVNITTAMVYDLHGYNVGLTFDSSVVTYLGASDGGLFSDEGLACTFSSSACDTVGTVARAAGGMVDEGGLSTSGVLCSFKFKAHGIGLTPLTLTSPTLLDKSHNPFVLIIESSSLTIEAALPILFSSFKAAWAQDQGVKLTWQTLSETDSYSFEVQRSANPTSGFATLSGSLQYAACFSGSTLTYSYTDATASSGIWYYRIKETDGDLTEHYTEAISASVVSSVSTTELPRGMALRQNYPNPFNPSTNIQFQLPQSMQVRVTVFNAIGQQIAVLAEGFFTSGDHSVTWNAEGKSSGVYFCTMNAGRYTATKSMVLVR